MLSQTIVSHSIRRLDMIEPIGNKVVVELVKDNVESSIALPEGYGGEYQRGRVIAVGKGDPNQPTPRVVVGDMVVFKRVSAEKIVLDGNPYLWAYEHYLIGIERP
jgi:co-chaperonin GroES (HSP10)